MVLTKQGLLKAIRILKTEKKYYHQNFQNAAGNCFCALGAVAIAHGAYRVEGGKKVARGWVAYSAIGEHPRRTAAIDRVLGVFIHSSARVTRSQAINGVRLILKTYFGKN